MRKLLPCILLLSLLLPGCRNRQPVIREDFLLDTFVSVTLYDGGEEQAQGALDLCRSYEAVFSRADPDSELYRLNHREISQVSDDLAAVIALGLSYAARTGGAFDITTGSVTSLWDFSAETPQVPDPAAVAEGLAHVGWEKVSVTGNTVTFTDPETVIDLGAIAKGYIADQMADYLRGEGVTSAIIDLGGNLYCLGTKPGGAPFQVGVQYPYEDRQTVIGSLPASDLSVVTSGVYERCFTADGKLYHHILDTATGYPVENDLLSVTIVSAASVDGDALSTACFALGLEAGAALIEGTEGVEAVFVTDDFSTHITSGLEGVFQSA